MSRRQSVSEMLAIIATAGMFGLTRRTRSRPDEQRVPPEILFGVANAERAREKHRQKIQRRLERWNGARAS